MLFTKNNRSNLKRKATPTRTYKNYTLNVRSSNQSKLGGVKDFFRKSRTFSSFLRIIFLSTRRRLTRIRNRVVRSFFWERSKSAKYIINSFVILLVIGFIALSFNGKPFTPQYVQAASDNKSIVSVEDYSITTQAGETQIPDTRKANEIIDYVVQSGDTVSSIADKFGISADTVRRVNGINNDIITVGQNLRILPVSGLLHKVGSGDSLDGLASKYRIADEGFSSQIIVEWNNLDDNNLVPGTELIIPGGKPEAPKAVYVPPRVVASGPTVDTGNFRRPTSGGSVVISQCYRGYAHDGVDMAKVWNGATPNIVAARAGTVVFSGWQGGWTIVMRHSGGFETVYYHMAYPSPRRVGDQLNAGDFLGVMGSTGRSTGVHLHFIIRINGVTINPLSQVNLRNPGDLVSC